MLVVPTHIPIHIVSTNLHTLFDELAHSLSMDLPSPPQFPLQLSLGDVAIAIEHEEATTGRLVIRRPLGAIPLPREMEIARALLETNLFWSGTGDVTIGAHAGTREATLAYRVDYRALNVEGLRRLLEQFVALSEVWRRFIEELEHEQRSAIDVGFAKKLFQLH